MAEETPKTIPIVTPETAPVVAPIVTPKAQTFEESQPIAPVVAPKEQVPVDAMAPFYKEFEDTGVLSDESITAAAKASGFSEEAIRNHVQMSQDNKTTQTNAFFEGVGGQDSWKSIQEWAAKGIPDLEKASLNEMLNSGDMSKMQIARDHIHNAYKAVNVSTPIVDPAPKLLKASGAAPIGIAVFDDVRAQSRAINDPRYKSNPEYRKWVEDRLI